MKNFFLFVFILGLNYISSVWGDFYDITTIHKFNVEEELSSNGEILTNYLNTCQVTVHAQTNAVGLPIYNVNDTELNQIYPHHTDRGNNTLGSLPNEYVLLEGDIDFDLNIKSRVNPDKTVLHVIEEPHTETRHKYNYYGDYSSYDFKYYKYNFDMSKVKDLPNICLFLENKKQNSKEQISLSLDRADGKNIAVKISNDGKIEVCQKEYCQSYVYKGDEKNQISIYISLRGELKIYDFIGKRMYTFSNIDEPFIKISQSVSSDYYTTPMTFQIVQLSYINIQGKNHYEVFSDNRTIAATWNHTGNRSNVFVFHYRKLDGILTAQLKENGTENIIPLEAEEQIVVKIPNNEVDELVLTKIQVRYPQTWTQGKQIQIKADKGVYIARIWEGEDWSKYRVHENITCGKEIYNVAFGEPRLNKNKTVTAATCLNGGFPDQYNETCVCPPGFTGDKCQTACGRNAYGHKCSNVCSTLGTQCKGMLLCTPSYGCTCAPGYHGDKCLQQCKQGTYGTDCKQSCDHCQNGCNRYTGHCIGECVNSYLIMPSCREYYTYWKDAPSIVNSSFNSVVLGLNFSLNHIAQSSDKTEYYMVQYKENNEMNWNNGSYETFSPTVTEYEVNNLKPGRKYLFRVLLVANTFRTNDPAQSQTIEAVTKCKVTEITNNLNVTNVSNSLIALAWNNETTQDETTDCPFTSYTLDIEQTQDGYVDKRKIINITRNNIEVKPLAPGQTYLINLRKNTVYGESSVVSSVRVTIDNTIDDQMDVAGVIITDNGSDVHLKWFRNPLCEIYYIKYKLIRHMSCREDQLQSPWQVVATSYTNYTLALEANSQYELFVAADKTQEVSESMQTLVTVGTLPNTSPLILQQRFRATNESAQLCWHDSPLSCMHMNGFFKNYLVEVIDSQNTTINTYRTEEKKIEITGLLPRTKYKVRVRYVNHLGSNPLIYAEHYFTTKATSFLTAQDLVAYKTSANTVGIRWKILDTNSTITGINIKVQNHVENKSVNITDLTTVQCKAWPSYLCYTITQLKQNTRYTVSVEIYSEEFPEGGSHKSIQAITRESVPDAVSDITVADISNTTLTLSWRIPNLLNGTLRKFLIEVEHLSSLNESLCCQTILPINLPVTEEQEFYSQVIDGIQNAASYQITVRAFTKRLGPDVSKIIDTPPDTLPFQIKPSVRVNGEEIVWEDVAFNITATKGNELTSDIMIMVRSDDTLNANKSAPSSLGRELRHHLQSNDWWLAGVCSTSEECVITLGTNGRRNSSYGEIHNKPLTVGSNYTVLVAQVNKYLSARSVTIAKSAPFEMKQPVEPVSTTTQTPVQSSSQGTIVIEPTDNVEPSYYPDPEEKADYVAPDY
uniref:Tyrosine-protein kinase receptor Tie-1 n=1 Tax=Cacopsylla melanoneura TaxID=428564 RepID=A0A8D9AD61_9HEMI